MGKSWSRLEGDDRSSVLSLNSVDSSSSGRVLIEDDEVMAAERIKEVCSQQLPSSQHRFRTVFKRTMLQCKRDIVFMLGRLVAYTCTSILIGMTFQFVGKDAHTAPSNIAFMFFFVKIFTMGTGIVTIMNSHLYLDVFLREHINSWYGISSFYLSRTIIEAVVNTLIVSVFSLCMWTMTSQQQVWWPTVIVLPVTLLLHCLAVHHFCFVITMFAERASLPQIPFALIMLQVIFGGYFVMFEQLPVSIYWFRYLTHGSFTFVAVSKLGYSAVVSGHPVKIPCKTMHPLCERYRTGDDMLTEYGISTTSSYWVENYQLVIHVAGFFLIGWLLIAVYLRKEKKGIARI